MNISYILAFAIMVIWLPLLSNLIFTLFLMRTQNNRFKFRFGGAEGYKHLNPFLGTGKVLIVFLIFELLVLALNLIFFNKLTYLLSLTEFHTIPIFLFTLNFFIFWITKNDMGVSWKNKWVYIPFGLFLFIFIIWGVVLIILYTK